MADVTYHDYEGIALYKEEQARMAADLGKTSKAMILRNHGLLALAARWRPSRSCTTLTPCQIQVDACAGGMHNVHLMSEQAAKTASTQFKRARQRGALRTGRRYCGCWTGRDSLRGVVAPSASPRR